MYLSTHRVPIPIGDGARARDPTHGRPYFYQLSQPACISAYTMRVRARRTRTVQLLRHRSKPPVGFRTCGSGSHFCAISRQHELVVPFDDRSFASHPPNPIKVTLLGYIYVECMSSRVYFAHCMYCVVVVHMAGSAAVAQISERPRSIAYPVCST